MWTFLLALATLTIEPPPGGTLDLSGAEDPISACYQVLLGGGQVAYGNLRGWTACTAYERTVWTRVGGTRDPVAFCYVAAEDGWEVYYRGRSGLEACRVMERDQREDRQLRLEILRLWMRR